MNRAEALRLAEQELGKARDLLSQGWASGMAPDVVQRQSDSYTALGRAYVALAAELGKDETAAVFGPPGEPEGALCGHRRGVIRSPKIHGQRDVWLHASDMSACDSPPTG